MGEGEILVSTHKNKKLGQANSQVHHENSSSDADVLHGMMISVCISCVCCLKT